MERRLAGIEKFLLTHDTALRGYLLQGGEVQPEWFTGHSAPGLPSTGGHMALLPLAIVGPEHADGHLLGLAVAFLRAIPAAERATCLRGRLFGPFGDDLEPELQLGQSVADRAGMTSGLLKGNPFGRVRSWHTPHCSNKRLSSILVRLLT